MTVAGDDARERARAESRAVRIAELCEAIATAHRSVSAVTSPDATRLPVEPLQKIPLEALKNSAERRAGGLLPYQMQLSDFDVALLTPLQVFAGQGRSGQTYAPTLRDFGHWEEYVETLPSVLLVRVSPKFEEGFWTKVARGAASTQGVSLPPLKRFKAGFSRLRAYCGDKEITPIHPLTITHRINEKDTVSEGLYAFDPGAFDPSCANVRLLVYPDKEDEKPDTLIVAREVLQQVWQDFAAYRALQ
jgi:hypothetical protein